MAIDIAIPAALAIVTSCLSGDFQTALSSYVRESPVQYFASLLTGVGYSLGVADILSPFLACLIHAKPESDVPIRSFPLAGGLF